jgi:TPR repeat protein
MTKGSISLVVLIAVAALGWVGWTAWQDHARETAYREGLALVDEGRFKEALALAEPHAESGDPNIDHLLAQVYLNAPKPLNDESRGVMLQRRAMEAGQSRATYFLARLLLSSDPASDEGRRLLSRLVECKMPRALLLRAKTMARESPDREKLGEALDMVRIAALTGLAEAQWGVYVVGSMIGRLDGFKDQNLLVESAAWLVVAARNGHEAAGAHLGEMNEMLETASSGEQMDISVQIDTMIDRQTKLIDPAAEFMCLN